MTRVHTYTYTPAYRTDTTTGIIHATVGLTVGGLAGMLLFKAGRGNRAMSLAAGLGVALGSTYERAVTATEPQD
jgi:hypothetical protein